MRAEAQISGGLKLGGISLGFGQNRLLLAYKILVGCYLGFFYFTARAATFEALFSALLLILVAFTRDVGGNFDTARQPHASHFAQRGVGLS